MILLPSICRLQTLCTMRSVIFRRLHILSRLGSQQICASQCLTKAKHFESGVCFYPQQKIGYPCFRDIRSFSTDPLSKPVHVLDSDDKLIQKMTLKKAQILAHKEGKKLFRVPNEGANNTGEYKLLSEADFHKEISKYKVEKMKEFNFGVNIDNNHLSTKLQLIKQRLLRGSAVRIVLSSQGYAKGQKRPLEGKLNEDAERVMATCVESLNDTARVTRVVKGRKSFVMEFQIHSNIKNRPQ
ncbi:uncharacterized protein LOC117329185 [Pecten maximus]|uniref:uncharacterized protein LOC117329185 n=1 Tax=Pecten maximus TaxID=6579 RepID=UPI001458370B|nr:uncharacterized protein LOC117329185 [Pecten maximus]XP_033742880.1 uncharacterized protein LOC117329185 [Pecten maximus]XP_033742881.1 uncharacterized protein LOC117329185 [Pecten maximus]XP_033742882.1 uncharacterized protein LOC117329185 [Pecten maximus]